MGGQALARHAHLHSIAGHCLLAPASHRSWNSFHLPPGPRHALGRLMALLQFSGVSALAAALLLLLCPGEIAEAKSHGLAPQSRGAVWHSSNRDADAMCLHNSIWRHQRSRGRQLTPARDQSLTGKKSLFLRPEPPAVPMQRRLIPLTPAPTVGIHTGPRRLPVQVVPAPGRTRNPRLYSKWQKRTN